MSRSPVVSLLARLRNNYLRLLLNIHLLLRDILVCYLLLLIALLRITWLGVPWLGVPLLGVPLLGGDHYDLLLFGSYLDISFLLFVTPPTDTGANPVIAATTEVKNSGTNSATTQREPNPKN